MSTETQIVSINDIPEIQRRKSETLTELIEQVTSLKANQVLCKVVPRTKKGKINRQLSVKVSNQLGEKYTVQSRMGVEKLKQNVEELYLYIYRTPTPVATTK